MTGLVEKAFGDALGGLLNYIQSQVMHLCEIHQAQHLYFLDVQRRLHTVFFIVDQFQSILLEVDGQGKENFGVKLLNHLYQQLLQLEELGNVLDMGWSKIRCLLWSLFIPTCQPFCRWMDAWLCLPSLENTDFDQLTPEILGSYDPYSEFFIQWCGPQTDIQVPFLNGYKFIEELVPSFLTFQEAHGLFRAGFWHRLITGSHRESLAKTGPPIQAELVLDVNEMLLYHQRIQAYLQSVLLDWKQNEFDFRISEIERLQRIQLYRLEKLQAVQLFNLEI